MMKDPHQKKEIRKTHLKKRLSHNKQTLNRLGKKILKTLEKQKEFRKAKTVFLYMPIKNEVDTIPLIKKYFGKKQIAIPKIHEGEMDAREIKSLKEVKRGKYNIPEPNEKNKKIDPRKMDLVIIPGISFDKKGVRIGYGRGYYDYFLKKIKCPKIALAYEFQIHENIPVEVHDEKVDIIITENRIYNIPSQTPTHPGRG